LYLNEASDPFDAGIDSLVLYGHHMKDGSMLTGLKHYSKKAFFQAHPTLRFDTLYRRGEWAVLAAFITPGSMDAPGAFAFHTFIRASGAEEFDAFVARCQSLALYDTGITAQYGDKLLTLVTCYSIPQDTRFRVVAKRTDGA